MPPFCCHLKLGDGAGVGKGRTVAGVIYESFRRDRKKAIWVSVSADLVEDSKRDLRDIGAKHIAVHNLSKVNRMHLFSLNCVDFTLENLFGFIEL